MWMCFDVRELWIRFLSYEFSMIFLLLFPSKIVRSDFRTFYSINKFNFHILLSEFIASSNENVCTTDKTQWESSSLVSICLSMIISVIKYITVLFEVEIFTLLSKCILILKQPCTQKLLIFLSITNIFYLFDKGPMSHEVCWQEKWRSMFNLSAL